MLWLVPAVPCRDIIDEAHERTKNTDTVMLVREAVDKRTDLKVGLACSIYLTSY